MGHGVQSCIVLSRSHGLIVKICQGIFTKLSGAARSGAIGWNREVDSMLLGMTCAIAACIAIAAADITWRGRHEADLRRRWRNRPRQPWRVT